MTKTKKTFLYILSGSYILAGIMHYVMPEFYIRIMPPYFSAPAFWVYLTGAIEIGLGLMVLVPKLQVRAAWGIVALLIAFLPVHVFMLQNSEQFADLGPEIGLWMRFPMQAVMIGFAWWFTQDDTKEE